MGKYVKKDLGTAERIICLSDIHGEISLFEKIMDELRLTDVDELIIIGDFCNKGDFCMELTECIYEMSKKPNVTVLSGNGEFYNMRSFRSGPEYLLSYGKKWTKTLFTQWAQRLGYDEINEDNAREVHAKISENFGEIIGWLETLPWWLESEEYIFVHAGMESIPKEGEEDDKKLLMGTFLQHGVNATGKWLVVGHWPNYNIGEGCATNGVIIDEKRRVISIDGGINTKRFARLNALAIENGKISSVGAHHFPLFEASRDVIAENPFPPLQDDWPDYKLEILQAGEDFSLCKKRISGKIGLVKNEHIGEGEGGAFFKMSSNSFFISAKKGEIFAMLDENCTRYAYVMDGSGRLGWLPKDAAGTLINK